MTSPSQFTAIRPRLTMQKMKKVQPERQPISDETFRIVRLDYYRQMYDALYPFKKDMEKATKYFNGDQWHEYTTDRYGNTMREDEFISTQGQIPIVQNIIKPAVRSLQGQFRASTTKSIVVSRTPEKGKESEMLSNTLEYSLASVNESKEVDSVSLEKLFIAGLAFQQISYEYIPDLQRKDAIFRDVNLYSMFFNGDIEDVRGTDLRCIGRLLDFTKEELLMHFGKTPQRKEKLNSIYSAHTYDEFNVYGTSLDPNNHYSKDFYVPNDLSKCRVILVWEKRTVDQMEVHDWMDGKIYYTDWSEADLKKLNDFRLNKYLQLGVQPEEVPLMEGKTESVQKWFYTYYSPWGHILEEGESPFKHGGHPFIMFVHKINDGKISGLVTDLIATQRQFNRLHILNDRILASSVKNTLIIDKNSLDGQTKEKIGDDMKEAGGVVVLDLDRGKAVPPQEIKGSIGNLGIPEMIQLYMKTMQDVSGVHPAMQGQVANAGTSGKLYQQQSQNSAMNSRDIMDSFAAGQRRRDMKLLKTIQQYYDSPVMIAIAGKSYTETAQLYDPEKIKDIEFDLVIGQTNDSPVYRSMLDDKLFAILQAGMIDLEMFLEATSEPLWGTLLDSVRNRKRQMEIGAADPRQVFAGLQQDVSAAAPQANQQVVDQVYQKMKQ